MPSWFPLLSRPLTTVITTHRAGWRYQIGPWVRAGYRVVAPDMLGYGETDKPYDPEEYSLRRISDDLASILDIIRVRKAVSPDRVRSRNRGR